LTPDQIFTDPVLPNHSNDATMMTNKNDDDANDDKMTLVRATLVNDIYCFLHLPHILVRLAVALVLLSSLPRLLVSSMCDTPKRTSSFPTVHLVCLIPVRPSRPSRLVCLICPSGLILVSPPRSPACSRPRSQLVHQCSLTQSSWVVCTCIPM
jgi:hypothetical protein